MDSYLVLRVLRLDIDEGFFIYLEENGNVPEIQIKEKDHYQDLIQSKLQECFSNPDLIYQSRSFSTIYAKEDRIEIVFNFFAHNSTVLKGEFVRFNEESIELYRHLHKKKRQ